MMPPVIVSVSVDFEWSRDLKFVAVALLGCSALGLCLFATFIHELSLPGLHSLVRTCCKANTPASYLRLVRSLFFYTDQSPCLWLAIPLVRNGFGSEKSLFLTSK